MARWVERIAKVLLGNVSFGETMSNSDQATNVNSWKATGTTPGTANTAFTINHSLSDGNSGTRVPIAIVGQVTDNGGLIYGDVTTWTKTTVTLKCTTASANYRVILA
jgi:hypothetical protein